MDEIKVNCIDILCGKMNITEKGNKIIKIFRVLSEHKHITICNMREKVPNYDKPYHKYHCRNCVRKKICKTFDKKFGYDNEEEF